MGLQHATRTQVESEGGREEGCGVVNYSKSICSRFVEESKKARERRRRRRRKTKQNGNNNIQLLYFSVASSFLGDVAWGWSYFRGCFFFPNFFVDYSFFFVLFGLGIGVLEWLCRGRGGGGVREGISLRHPPHPPPHHHGGRIKWGTHLFLCAKVLECWYHLFFSYIALSPPQIKWREGKGEKGKWGVQLHKEHASALEKIVIVRSHIAMSYLS